MKRKRWTLSKIAVVVVFAIVAIPVLAIGAFFLYLFAWFHAGAFFSGDGEYRTGAGEASFQVAFPPIDLSRPGRYRYQFTRLGPSLSYSAGLRVRDRSGSAPHTDEYGRSDLLEKDRPSALVAISLTNERHQRVFAHTRRLSEWNWLRNMARIDGQRVEVPIGGGSVRIELVGVSNDGGWGTHFTPRWRGKYVLEVQVLEPDARATALIAQPVIEGYTALP